MFKSITLQCALLLLLVSCAKTDDSKDTSVTTYNQKLTCIPESKLLASGIIGGARVQESDPDAHNVILISSSTASGEDSEFCTAAAISPRVLLTAAHCINGPASGARVFFYSSISCESGFDSRFNMAKVKDVRVHPEYQPTDGVNGSKNDLALIFLNNPIPLSYNIYKIASSDDVTNENSLYFWGYGIVGEKKGGSGILRKTQFDGSNYKILTAEKRIEIDQAAGHGICMGDSGGPAIVRIDNSLQILGVNSYVSQAKAAAACTDKASATLVEAFIPWITEKLVEKNEHLKN